MPNIKSAKERVKTDAKKRINNRTKISAMRTALKKANNEIKSESKENVAEKINEANKRIDKALKAGIIKKNTAARNKSKLMKNANKNK